MIQRIGQGPPEFKSLEVKGVWKCGRRPVRDYIPTAHPWRQLGVPNRNLSQEMPPKNLPPDLLSPLEWPTCFPWSQQPLHSKLQNLQQVCPHWANLYWVPTLRELTVHWALLWGIIDTVPDLPGNGGICTTQHEWSLPVPAVIWVLWVFSFTCPHRESQLGSARGHWEVDSVIGCFSFSDISEIIMLSNCSNTAYLTSL